MNRVKLKNIFCFISIFILTGLSANTNAENLGVYGEVFPITEMDMLNFIHDKLMLLNQTGQLQKIQKEFNRRVIAHTLRPNPVTGLSSTLKDRVFYYDPSITVQHDIFDENGNRLIQAGTKVNPLDHIQLQERLIFIDADDKDQLSWANSEIIKNKKNEKIKLILINGNIQEASRVLGRVYFDQNGTLTKKLGIKHTPAMVYQSGKKLEIHEVRVGV